MTVRSLPSSLAAATARSAARSRPTASVPCIGLVATPKLIVTRTAASAKVRWVARRRRSATMNAPRSSVSGSRSANSSPPIRAAWSMRRFHLRQSLATSCRATSPAAWPWRSFTAENESRSPTITDSGRPARLARSSSMSSISSRARRLRRPVRGSVRAALAIRPRNPAMRLRWYRARPASAIAQAYGTSGARVPTGSISRSLSTAFRYPLKGLPRNQTALRRASTTSG